MSQLGRLLKVGCAAALVAAYASACGPAPNNVSDLDPHADTGPGFDLDGSGDGSGDALSIDCKPACVPPQKCSITGTCIDGD